MTAGTVCRELHHIQHALSIAIREWGYHLPENVAEKVKKPRLNNARNRRVSQTEIDRLVAELAEIDRQDIIAVIHFAVETGMRRGEILSLEWRFVDLKRRTAHLPQTKNGHARTVPLTNGAIAVLESQPRTNSLVFSVSSDALKMCWRRIMAKTGINDLHFHDLRHEAVSRFFEMGLCLRHSASDILLANLFHAALASDELCEALILSLLCRCDTQNPRIASDALVVAVEDEASHLCRQRSAIIERDALCDQQIVQFRDQLRLTLHLLQQREAAIQQCIEFFAARLVRTIFPHSAIPRNHDSDKRVLISVPVDGDLDRITAEIRSAMGDYRRNHHIEDMRESRAKYQIKAIAKLQSLHRQLRVYQMKKADSMVGNKAIADEIGIGSASGEYNPNSVIAAVSRYYAEAQKLIHNVGEGRFPDYSEPTEEPDLFG